MIARLLRAPVALTAPALLAVAVALVPLVYLIDTSFSRGVGAVVDEIFLGRTAVLVVRTLALTVVVTMACAIVGTINAWFVVRSSVPMRPLWLMLLAMPLAIPSYLSGFAWISWIPSLDGFVGASIVLTLASYPYVMLPVAAMLRGTDPMLEDVARSLGVGPTVAMMRVTLRQIAPAIWAGSLLVALYIVSDFGAVAAMRLETFTWVIYGAYRSGFNPTRAATLSLVLVALALLLVALERVPVVSAISWMQSAQTSTDWNDLWSTIAATLGVGALTGVASLLLALPVGILIARFKGRFTDLTEGAVFITHSLPGIVVALAVVYFGINLVRPLYQQLPLLVFGQVIIFLPLVVGSVRTSIEQSRVALEDVSRSLGVSRMQTVFRVTIPLALPGVMAGGALAVLGAMKELPTTLLLRPTGVETLATSIWKHSVVSDFAAVGPYAVALVVIAALPTALLSTVTVLKVVT
ncbi:MAG: iron ABC transporter permease [Actinobacteria bacterium]|nr:iron ABC transporter permease [Actinomycetota bacterium]